MCDSEIEPYSILKRFKPKLCGGASGRRMIVYIILCVCIITIERCYDCEQYMCTCVCLCGGGGN